MQRKMWVLRILMHSIDRKYKVKPDVGWAGLARLQVCALPFLPTWDCAGAAAPLELALLLAPVLKAGVTPPRWDLRFVAREGDCQGRRG